MPSTGRTRYLRERFGLTQSEMALALGVSLRTVQNWEQAGARARGLRLQDLEELRDTLEDVMSDSEIPVWLRSVNDTFGGRRPLDLLAQGKARDIIVEFRRLQAGDPV